MRRSLIQCCAPIDVQFSGCTRMVYPPSVSTQLAKYKSENGYTSRLWITTEDLGNIKNQYKLTLKEGEQPSIVYQPDRAESQTEMYNSDQFTDPYFIKLYSQISKFQTRKVDEKDIKWKRVAAKLRDASWRKS